MGSGKLQRLARKSALLQQEVLQELNALVKSIERGEVMLAELKADTEAMNARHQHRQTTRDDIAYLEDLLKCAKQKLAWEKQMEKLAERTPVVLASVSAVINDPQKPPSDEIRQSVLASLQKVQAAMARLDVAKNT